MADDRLYLRCRKCGEAIFFWKHYVGAGYLPHSEAELSDWMKGHLLLCDGRQDFGTDPSVEIITEMQKLMGELETAVCEPSP